MKTIYTGWQGMRLAPELAVEEDAASEYYGWLFVKHPDGQWVTVANLKLAFPILSAREGK